MKKKDADLRLKFIGDFDGIEAEAFFSIFGSLFAAIRQINKNIRSDESKVLEITIKELKSGSFDILLSFTESILDPIFRHILARPFSATAELIAIFLGILEIKKHLKGKEPKKVEQTDKEAVITNAFDEVEKIDIRIYNILVKDGKIERSISRGFNEIIRLDPIDALYLQDYKNKKKLEINRQQIEHLSSQSGLLLPEPEKDVRKKLEKAELKVIRIVFEPGYMWQFYYQGNKINAVIWDESFYGLIDEGKKFSKGDSLIVDLEIVQVFDKSVQTYVNKEFIVTRIKKHIPRSEQKKLF